MLRQTRSSKGVRFFVTSRHTKADKTQKVFPQRQSPSSSVKEKNKNKNKKNTEVAVHKLATFTVSTEREGGRMLQILSKIVGDYAASYVSIKVCHCSNVVINIDQVAKDKKPEK
jgi:hypothetical protein